MSNFADLMPDADLMELLGDDVIYIAKRPPGVAIKAIVDYDNQKVFAGESYVPQTNITVEALKADVPGVAKGSRFVHESRTLTVDAVLINDHTYLTLAVR